MKRCLPVTVIAAWTLASACTVARCAHHVPNPSDVDGRAASLPTHPSSSSADDTAILTISAANDIHRVRNFMSSARQHHPVTALFWCAYALRRDIAPDHESRDYTTIATDELGIADLVNPSFWYPVVDGSTFIKPYCFRRIFHAFNKSRVLFFDNDIMLFQPMDTLFALLSNHTFVLTPHILQPAPDDGKKVSDLDIVSAGTFNLGFIGLSHTAAGAAFLTWWQRKLYDQGFIDPPRGMMNDQKWVDMVGALFGGVHIVRDPTYNAAYWNIHERGHAIAFHSASSVTLEGRPLHFYHFSGYDYRTPDVLSRHQDRYTFADVPNLKPLFAYYGGRVKRYREQLGSVADEPFATFDNGVRVGARVKKFFALAPPSFRDSVGNPFHTAPANGTYFTYLDFVIDNACDGSRYVSNLLLVAAYTCPHLISYRANLCSSAYDVKAAYRDAMVCLDLRDTQLLRWSLARQRFRRVRMPAQYDVVFVGYMTGSFGVAQGGRMLAKALAAAGTSVKHVTLHSSVHAVSDDRMVDVRPATRPGTFNVFHVNADQAETTSASFWARFAPENALHSFNLGVWYWELEDFPADLWPGATTNLTEVWVASSFVERAVAAKSTVPVYRFVPPFPVAAPGRFSLRKRVGLKPSTTLFFFNFDYHSYHRRKNPDGVVAAFAQAFGAGDDVALVVKAAHVNAR